MKRGIRSMFTKGTLLALLVTALSLSVHGTAEAHYRRGGVVVHRQVTHRVIPVYPRPVAVHYYPSHHHACVVRSGYYYSRHFGYHTHSYHPNGIHFGVHLSF